MAYQNPTTYNAPGYSGPGDQFNIPSLNNPFNFGQQRNENTQWNTGYTNAINSQPKYSNILDKYNDRYMIPQLTEQVRTYDDQAAQLANQLSAMPRNVAATTTESLVSDPQRQRIVEARSEPLYQSLQTVGNLGQAARSGLQTMQGQVNNSVNAEIAQLDKELQPWERSYDMMTVMQAREFSGWNSEMERELNTLLANQQAGLTWTNAEAQRASSLKIAREGYKNQLDQIQKQQDYQTQVDANQATFYSYL